MKFDRDLTSSNIQDLSSSDAITAFFASLGYNTDVRTQQTPANLGIVADGILRPIKRIDLIADQDGLLQVYLFELKTVTVTQARNLAQVFKNRSGNYLLVLTSDYERIDFALIEKFVPQKATPSKGIGQPHIGVRPRMLTVDRRKPANIHLRVLRRFTYTEADPIAQYDKLISAFTIADWSEEHFNNRALFSDHYMINRLPNDPGSWPEWREDPKPAYRVLNDLYRNISSRVANKGEQVLSEELIEPSLHALGFKASPTTGKVKDKVLPDYLLYSREKPNNPLAYCLVYPWMRYLDGKDETRDDSRPDDNPSQKVVSLLEQGDVPWAIVTNGKIWRLYSQKTHAKATNYYEIDLDEILSQDAQHAGGPGDPFRYFWLIFRRQAFELESGIVRGETKQLSFLDRLLNESEEYAKELGERLKERVFEEVFPLISDGYIEYIRDRDGVKVDLSQEALDVVFLGTLTLLYRLLFLLYAEARDLLPVKEVRGYYEASLTKIKTDIAEIADTIEDEVEAKIRKAFKADEYSIYDRLNILFKVIDIGDDSVNVPVYNGGLFVSEPRKDDQSPEGRNARFLTVNKVPDRFLARAIDLLARGIDPKRHDLVPVDYKSLGVRQLGSIYEGLLEFKLRLAETKMAIVKGKKTEEVIPYPEAVKNKRKILTIGRGKDAKERIYKKGEVYLENDKKERKATGSYYTPDHIVKYIVEHAVGPVLEEKFEAMRPKLRQAQLQRKAWFDRQKAMTKPNPESQLDSIMPELADELFDIKVLDPAMGSGHFLVEAVDFITDKALTFLMAFPWNPIITRLERTRREILDEMDRQGINIDPKRLDDIHLLKRHVLKRCIYGVDLNPMAVELAKVSLWLDCFTLGAPLSFLDHHLKCGNSLIGVTVEEVDTAVTGEGASLGLFSKPLQSIKASLKTMLEIGDLPDVTPSQVAQSRNLYSNALSKTQSLKRLLDVYTSQWFGNSQPAPKGKNKGKARNLPLEFLNSEASVSYRDAIDQHQLDKARKKLPPEYRQMVETAEHDAESKRFFHWEMEYPEVFYKVKGDTVERVEGAGFDAVVGNPPYDVMAEKELSQDITSDLCFFESSAIFQPALRGKKNLYKLFVCREASLVGNSGMLSLIVPMVLLGDDQAADVRRLLLTEMALTAIEAFPQKDDALNRVFREAKLATAVFVASAVMSNKSFSVCTYKGNRFEDQVEGLHVAPLQLLTIDPDNLTIPSCTQRDWEILLSITKAAGHSILSQFAEAHQGEINETSCADYLSGKGAGPQVLRGSCVCLYALREPSQGEERHLDVKRFLHGRTGGKALAHHNVRIGFQRKAPQNNFRRLIACKIPSGNFCFDSISYISESDSDINLDLLLALLNSQLLDWWFRTRSTNSTINDYQIKYIPIPRIVESAHDLKWFPLLELKNYGELTNHLCSVLNEPCVMPRLVGDALIAMSDKIQDIEQKRIMRSRSDRSHLDPESQKIQDVIDKVFFRCYGLTDEEGEYVTMRLGEML